MAERIAPPNPNRAIIDESGIMDPTFRLWTQRITIDATIIGTGSPEGVVSALQGAEYMDDSGTTGAIKYVKRDADIGGDTSQGWILI